MCRKFSDRLLVSAGGCPCRPGSGARARSSARRRLVRPGCFGPYERRAPRVGHELLVPVGFAIRGSPPSATPSWSVRPRPRPSAASSSVTARSTSSPRPSTVRTTATDIPRWPVAAALFRFFSALAVFLSSPSIGSHAASGTPLGHQLGRRAEQGVAVLDVGVEERERQAGLHGLHPQAHLAQLDGHRVEVHAVDAAADDLPQRVAVLGGRGRAVRRSRATCAASRRAAASRKWPEPQAGSTMDSSSSASTGSSGCCAIGVGRSPARARCRAAPAPGCRACSSCRWSCARCPSSRRRSRRRTARPSWVICGTSSSRLS